MSENENSNRSVRGLIIGLAILAVGLSATAAFGVWVVNKSTTDFESYFGHNPHDEEALVSSAVGQELVELCNDIMVARAQREKLSIPVPLFGAPGNYFAEFDKEVARAEVEVENAKRDFIWARASAEHFGFKLASTACNNLRQRPMGIPR